MKPSQNEIDIKNSINQNHLKELAYGVRRIRNEFIKLGFNIDRRLTRRYMQYLGIEVFYPGTNLSKRAKMAKTYPYLLGHLPIERPNQVWSIDIWYIGTSIGFVNIAAIIDWYSRYLVGYSISSTLHTGAVTYVVKEAVGK